MFGCLVLVAVAYFAWPSQWGGATTFVVVEGTSMQPTFHTGDFVIARETSDHEVGDILVYAVPEGYTGAGKLILHRLTSIDADGRYTIQGDNRSEPDQFDVGPEDVVGVAITHIPKVGVVTQVLGQWWFIAGLVGLFALVKLRPRDEDGEKTSEEADDREASCDDEWHQREERRLGVDRRVAAAGLPVVPAVEPRPAPGFVGAAGALLSPGPPPQSPPPPPPARIRRTQPYVIVDGQALAHVGWPTVELAVTRQMAVDAADDIAGRFGTVAAVVFEPSPRPVSDRPNAQVEFAPAGATLVDTVRTHLDGRRPGLTMLVVTDSLSVAEEVCVLGGSVMRCQAWLALGQHVGTTVDAPACQT